MTSFILQSKFGKQCYMFYVTECRLQKNSPKCAFCLQDRLRWCCTRQEYLIFFTDKKSRNEKSNGRWQQRRDQLKQFVRHTGWSLMPRVTGEKALGDQLSFSSVMEDIVNTCIGLNWTPRDCPNCHVFFQCPRFMEENRGPRGNSKWRVIKAHGNSNKIMKDIRLIWKKITK